MLYMDVVTMQASQDKDTQSARSKMPFEDVVTVQEIETVVKLALGPSVKIVNHHVRVYSEEKLGFLGAHRHLAVTVQREGSTENEIHTFFLKSVPYDIAEQASIIEDCRAFYKETNFYKRIVPELMRGLEDTTWIAQCYLVKDDLLVFEDLKSRNFALKTVHLDATALKSALSSLAKYHASSMLAEKRLGKSFLELCPELLEESLFVKTNRFHEWFRTSVDVLVAVAKQLGLDDGCVPKVCDRIYELIGPSKRWRNVVCHGDAKSYNLMFDDSRPLPKCVLVDFQLVRYTPAMNDLSQMLHLTTRREFRERNEEELLRHYHEALCETLREQDKEMDMPTLSEILQEYEELRVVGLVTTALYSPINLADGKMMADMTSDSDGFADLVYGDKVGMVLDIMQKDEFYKDVITEIVTEMVQRSKQLLS